MNRFISKWIFYLPVTLLKGERVLKYLSGYREFQFKSRDEIKGHQISALRLLIKHTMDNSPYYKKSYDFKELLDIGDNELFLKAFSLLPTLSKQQLIENKNSIVTNTSKHVSEKTTGGSTGEPVVIRKPAEALARERAATWRSYEWAGVSIGSKQARFWGIPHNRKNRFLANLIDVVANRKRFSAFDISDGNLPAIYAGMRNYRPEYVYGYVSAILELARYMLENGKVLTGVESVITTSEVLTKEARKTIEKAFSVKVYNEYGCGEVGSIAHECRNGSLHYMADNLYLETNDKNELFVTDLYNFETPLIRYNLGDFASLDQGACDCGTNLPLLSGVHGRAYDVVRTIEGRSIHPEAIIYIFEELQNRFPIFKQFQVVQTKLDEFLLYIVKSSEFDSNVMRKVVQEFGKHISSMSKVEVVFVESIPREASGKMRVVKSEVK